MASIRTRSREVGCFGLRPVLGLAAAVSLLALACGGSGGDLDERFSAIRARQDEGKAAETITELTELSERYTDNAELDYRLGLAMVASGRPTEAVFPLHKAAESDDYAVSAGILLASTLANTNNHAEALRAADRVLARDPEHEAALLLRATSAAQLHDGAIALESADRLVAKAPDNRNFAFVRASALAEVGRLDDAEGVYTELLAVDWEEDPQGPVRACASYSRFLIEKRKDTDRAVGVMKDCVDKAPDDIQMVAALGNMLDEFDRREDLIAILEDAVERHPDARPLTDALVAQLIADGRLNDAKALVEKWAGEADDAKSWSQVATVRRRIGDIEGALEAVDKAMPLADAALQQEIAFFRSELLLELGRLDEAQQQAAQVECRIVPHHPGGTAGAGARRSQARARAVRGDLHPVAPEPRGARARCTGCVPARGHGASQVGPARSDASDAQGHGRRAVARPDLFRGRQLPPVPRLHEPSHQGARRARSDRAPAQRRGARGVESSRCGAQGAR